MMWHMMPHHTMWHSNVAYYNTTFPNGIYIVLDTVIYYAYNMVITSVRSLVIMGSCLSLFDCVSVCASNKYTVVTEEH